MCRVILMVSFVLLHLVLPAQVVTTEPSLPTDNERVVLYFHSDEGSQGLKDFSGDVYVHIGVITEKSTSDSDWKYVKTSWGSNVPECKLMREAVNTYKLEISTSIRAFLKVPEGEKISKIAMVFRSSAGDKEGKGQGGKDIFVPVYEGGLNVQMVHPAGLFFIHPDGVLLDVTVEASGNEKINLLLDDQLIASSDGQALTHSFVPKIGKHLLKAVATKGDELVVDSMGFFVHSGVAEAALPAGLKDGVSMFNDQEVAFVLYAPQKEYVYLIGDFNEWEPGASWQMKKDGDRFWFVIDDVEPLKEYGFQYLIDGELRIADPYTEKILDPWNDKYIPEAIYPGLKAYPEGQTTEIVSVFQTGLSPYNWTAPTVKIPKKEDLVIYEILIRDFTSNQDIKTVTDTLGYLKRLGVNVIELMPFNEFEGNDSWGYNPSFYFATDKAYGTLNDYKAFVDACHQNGMAVVMDVVLNHSYGQSPLVRMYWDEGKPSAESPWYNRDHNMQNPDAQWGYDFNHESSFTKNFVDSVCGYWMSELKIDGFRFDFTKGFTNTTYGSSSWAGDYDPSRIALLKRVSTEIWNRKKDALVIFEHLSENKEEKELAAHGILLWGNANHNFNEATMGYHANSDFSWCSYKNRGWDVPNVINYMESHDEERLMFKNLAYGNSAQWYDVTIPETSLRRMEAAAAFFVLIPGPKMIWQFGELGYDVSIDEGGRLGQKPSKWEYATEPGRARLFELYANLIEMKIADDVFETSDFSLNVEGAFKQISLNMDGADVRLIGNFDVKEGEVAPGFSSTGWWYDHFCGDSIEVEALDMSVKLAPGQFKIYSQKKLTGFEVATGIEEIEFGQIGRVFPNPFSQDIEVVIKDPVSSIAVYNVFGQRIDQAFNLQKVTFESASWASGVYFVRVELDTGYYFSKKIVKN